MRGAPRMPATLLERLDAQAERNAERIRHWIAEGLLAPLDPYHLLLNLWAMTESYALGGWQLARLTGQAGLRPDDYRQAAENIVRLVCAGCLATSAESAARRRIRAVGA
ncbi:TetR family transcriptional regulator C-terminal domain-containing protein, partial [Pseudomonas paraeruginosa]